MTKLEKKFGDLKDSKYFEHLTDDELKKMIIGRYCANLDKYEEIHDRGHVNCSVCWNEEIKEENKNE